MITGAICPLSMQHTICIIIPVYNCYEALRQIVPKILRCSLPVCIVDDGSEETPEWLGALPIVVLRHATNRGKGAALKTGFVWALTNGYEAAITMDGDGQHAPDDLQQFIDMYQKYSVVVGRRDFADKRMPLHRKFSNTVTSKMLSVLLHTPILDAQCGYRCVQRSVLQKISLETDNYDTENELLIKAVKAGFNISFVPIKTIYNDSKSHIHGFRDTWRFLRAVLFYAVLNK